MRRAFGYPPLALHGYLSRSRNATKARQPSNVVNVAFYEAQCNSAAATSTLASVRRAFGYLPLALHGRLCCRRNAPEACKPSEVVDAELVIEVERTAHAVGPPGEAVVLHRTPVVQRAAGRKGRDEGEGGKGRGVRNNRKLMLLVQRAWEARGQKGGHSGVRSWG